MLKLHRPSVCALTTAASQRDAGWCHLRIGRRRSRHVGALGLCRLRTELLEDRRVLAVMVTNLSDAGPGSLRDAIDVANSAATPETIQFAVSGTIVLTSGELSIARAMTIDGQGQTVTVSGNGASRVMNIDGLAGPPGGPESTQVSIQNLAIIGGWVAPTSGNSIAGGAIRSAASLQLSNVTFSGNYAGLGGAVAIVGDGQLTANQITAQNNSAYYSGGAIYGDSTSLLVLSNSTISSNTAGMTNGSTYSSTGGGIFAAGDLQVTDTSFNDNAVSHVDPARGAFGGGVAIAANGDGSLGGVDSRLTNVTFQNNAAVGGGAVHVLSGSMDGLRVTITTNQAGQGGGLATKGTVTLRESTVSGNATINFSGIDAAGGGVLVGPGGQLTLHDSALENNHTTGRGGGAYVSSLGSSLPTLLTLNHSTVTGNSAQTVGGGIVAGTRASLSILGGSLNNNIATSRGGAVYASSFGNSVATSVSIQAATMDSNSSQELGGALLLGINVDAQVRNSNLQNNRAGSRGGAIYASNFLQGATNGRFSSITIQGSNISDNALTATSGLVLGGGIASGTNISLTITDSTLSGNQAGLQTGVNGRGGALYAASFGFVQTVNIERSQIMANQALGSGGGGLTIAQGTQSFIDDSTIDGNQSAGTGGGLHVAFGASAVVQRSTVSNNRASLGGGGIATFDASLDLENSTVSSNITLHDGGGIWASFNPSSQHVSIRFSTITQNVADEDGDAAGYGAGGMLVLPGSAFELRNSIVSGNSEGSGLRPADLYDPGYVGQIAYSLIEDPTGHTVTHGSDGNIVGVSAMLDDLELSFGFTKTHLPQSGSPVVDAADPSATLGVDQRRFPRPAGNRHDMGAVEYQSSVPFLGDFDLDGDLDIDDINALTTAVYQTSPTFPFDLNGDGQLALDDVDVWLAEAGAANLGSGRAYLPGDANLDGAVDGSDFGIWNSHRFTASSLWSHADFNADGSVDGTDFGVWNGHKFQSSDSLRGSTTFQIEEVAALRRSSMVPFTVLPFTGTSTTTEAVHAALSEMTAVAVSQRPFHESARGGAWVIAVPHVNSDHSNDRGIALASFDPPDARHEPSIAVAALARPTAYRNSPGEFAASRQSAATPRRAVLEEIFANW